MPKPPPISPSLQEPAAAAARDAMDRALAETAADLARFVSGETVWDYTTQPDQVHHMIYLVAYDIASPHRLRHVAKICEDFGARVEKSVFECDLPPEQFQKLWLRLMDEIDETQDAIIAYRICTSCLRETESIGTVARPEKPVCYIL